MKNEDIVKTVGLFTIGFVILPTLVNTTINLVGYTAQGISNGIEKVKFNKKIKKGLKDWSICKINGNYYEVEDNEEEA